MRFEIGFGVGFDKHGNPIDPCHVRECIKLILVEASRRFGGCNILAGQGAWVDDSGTLVVEDSRVLVVDTSANNRLEADNVASARQLAVFVRNVLEQQAVQFTQIVSTATVLREGVMA